MINETLNHPEWATFRAQTGGAYNIIGAYGIRVRGSAFPVKGAIPVPTGKSGTIISTGKKVRGTGTLFTREMKIGDYIYSKDVVRMIDYIESDFMLTLTEAFPTDITVAEIPLICETQFYKKIWAKNTHASADSIVQEAPLGPTNEFVNGGAPISYDATGGELEITVHK